MCVCVCELINQNIMTCGKIESYCYVSWPHVLHFHALTAAVTVKRLE